MITLGIFGISNRLVSINRKTIYLGKRPKYFTAQMFYSFFLVSCEGVNNCSGYGNCTGKNLCSCIDGRYGQDCSSSKTNLNFQVEVLGPAWSKNPKFSSSLRY